MKRTVFNQTLALMLTSGLIALPIRATADDIDIFTGASAGTAGNPRVLIVLDNTSNWSRQAQKWPDGGTQGQSEVNAIKNMLNTVSDSIDIGLLEFVTGGSANDNGGYIRQAVVPMNSDNATAFKAKLSTIYSNITSPNEKRNSNTPYGNLMYDAYNYFAGGVPYSKDAVVSSLADANGYTSSALQQFQTPLSLSSVCGKTFIIFIGNSDRSGPTADSSTNLSTLASVGGDTSQLGLPNYTQTTVPTNTTVGVTSQCYASSTAAAAEISNFSACTNGTYSEGCSIGSAASPTATTAISCPSGKHEYTVMRTIYTPPTTTSANGSPTTSSSTSNGTTTNYYGAATEVNTATDHGSLTCPSSTTADVPTNSGTDHQVTTYSCSFSVNDAVGTATTTTSSTSKTTSSCYLGVGSSAGYWDSTNTDVGGWTCNTASYSCAYSGTFAGNASGCTGSGYRKVNVKQILTNKRQYSLTMTTIASTTHTVTTTIPASTSAPESLGYTSQCYSSGPTSSTGDYATECSATNATCTYNNTPTRDTMSACPSGTSLYNVVGTDDTFTNVATSGSTPDTATYNADEWARFMHDKGIPLAGSTTTTQSITTYTIDVYNAQPNATQTSLLLSMAKAGGGRYFAAKSESAILSALQQITSEILATNSTFASTSLPVNATNRSQNENQVFIGMFRPDPDANPRWFGNLKRYKLIKTGSGVDLGDAQDDSQPAVNNVTGFITPCAVSWWTSYAASGATYWQNLGIRPSPESGCSSAAHPWSDMPDGPQVEKGAVAEVLRNGNNPTSTSTSPTYLVNRTMYTRSGDSLVAFSTTSASSLSTDVVNFTLGNDVAGGLDTNNHYKTRPSIHGDVIHSRPLPINYGGDTGVIVYYGANDGTFRAVRAADGKELWSFVAPESYSKLARLYNNTPLVSYASSSGAASGTTAKDYFFDGSTGVYQDAAGANVWVFPTMRRGGRMIYGFNVTDPASPSLLWHKGCPNLTDDTGCDSGFEGIGQTWSTPAVAQLKGYTTHPVIIVGGGYDSCEDANTATPSCSSTKGGVVYVLDAYDGSILAHFATARGVVADVALMDVDNDGKPDYAYAADLGGSIYRIDFVTPGTNATRDKDHWQMNKVAYTASSNGRKFEFAPAVLNVGSHAYVAIGTGDREHPLGWQYPSTAPVTNRFYVYYDNLALNADGTVTAINLDSGYDVTSTTSCTADGLLSSNPRRSWGLSLGAGEQVVTTALIAGGMVTFSTNRPLTGSEASCSAALGEARGYWVNLFNGSGAVGVDGTCGGHMYSTFVGGGLPPSPVLATAVPIDGQAVSVVIGAAQRNGQTSVAISPQKIRPVITSKRKQTYSYTKGQ